MNILALTKYGARAASTRQRFLQYRPALASAGFDLAFSPLLGDGHIRRIAEGRPTGRLAVVGGYARRLRALASAAHTADILWVHCELFPFVPALAERLAFLSRRPVVFDYDDAIFHMYDGRPFLAGKLRPLIAGAAAVTAGNAYLADYARQWNDQVLVVPTVVDTEVYVPLRPPADAPPVIGWIGSPSTWTYVRPLLPVIAEVCAATGARFLAVGAGPEAAADRFTGLELRDWTEAGEVADVQAMDVGIMPVPDEAWARGKCGYKLIQYMACGLPVVASPVGVNREIVREGENGLLAASAGEWRQALLRLVGDSALRQRLGETGRAVAVRDFSLESQAPRLVALFRSLTSAR